MTQKNPSARSDDSRQISFKPITEGLGFHPFSNGLPYAPMGKNPKVNPRSSAAPMASPVLKGPMPGAGALAAGVPRFIPVPRVSPLLPVAAAPLAKLPIQLQQAQAPPWEPGIGYLPRRVFAYIFDFTLNALLFLVVLSQTVWRGNFKFSNLLDPNVILVAGLFFLLLNWVVLTIEEMSFGVTPGKKIFGLMLRGSAVVLFLRAFFFIPSVAFFGIGLLWGLVDHRKCCWHDRLLDIQPMDV